MLQNVAFNISSNMTDFSSSFFLTREAFVFLAKVLDLFLSLQQPFSIYRISVVSNKGSIHP